MTSKTERFEMRLESRLLDLVDNWRTKQPRIPSRAEAIRSLVEIGLARDSSFTSGEILQTYMLCEIYKHLGVKGEMDPSFIQEVLAKGEFWALEWKYPGLFHNYVASKKVLHEVLDILDMYSIIENSYSQLNKKEQQYVLDQARFAKSNLKFIGFDGNNESEYMGIAGFIIEDMERYNEFQGRSLNSHAPTLKRYKKMLDAFEPIRETLIGTGMNKEQLVEVFNAPYTILED